MPRKRVLIVISSLAVGGPQRSLIGLLNGVDYDRFDVTLLVLNGRKSELRCLVPDSVRILDTPGIITSATLPKDRWLSAVASLLVSLPIKNSLALLRPIWNGATRRWGWQRVRQHVWQISASSLPKVPGSYDTAVGILGLSTYAVVDLVDSTSKYHWVRSDSRILARDPAVEDSYFSALDGAVAVSQQCADIYIEMYARMKGRVSVYKNDTAGRKSSSGVRSTWVLGAPEGIKILTVARLDPLKGIDVAIKAGQALSRLGVKFSWVVLGDGPERSRLEAAVLKSGLTKSFTLAGAVMNVEEYMASADIYVHPSLSEGRSNAVEEARSAGKPIVATRYPTVSDQITDGQDGLICDIDGESMAQVVVRLINDPEMRELIGAKAAERHAFEKGDPNQLLGAFIDGTIGDRQE